MSHRVSINVDLAPTDWLNHPDRSGLPIDITRELDQFITQGVS